MSWESAPDDLTPKALQRLAEALCDRATRHAVRVRVLCRPASVYSYLPAQGSRRRCGLNMDATSIEVRLCTVAR